MSDDDIAARRLSLLEGSALAQASAAKAGVPRHPRVALPPDFSLDLHMEQTIKERLELGHLYTVEDGPDGPEAICTPEAAASLWRAIQRALADAGFVVVRERERG